MNEEEEYESNVFGVFLRYIPNGQIDEAFAVNLDVNERHGYYVSLLQFYVTDDVFPDNPDVIERLLFAGYELDENDPAHCIAYGIVNNRLRCVRCLLKQFPHWLVTHAVNIFNDCWDWNIALIRLVDLGLNLDLIYKQQTIPRFIYNFTHARNIARAGAITVIGIFSLYPRLRRGGGGRDVARIIARIVWESRALQINYEDE